MEDNGVLVIAVFYGGKWTRKDNGGWVFQNYRIKIIDIKEMFMFVDVENEVYEILGIDRNNFFLRTNYEYNQCELPCDPQSIR